MKNLIPITEIFVSPQGEGILTGVPSVFVRIGVCNLRCAWCLVGNTFVSTDKGRKKIRNIKKGDSVIGYKNGHLCLTRVVDVHERQVPIDDIICVSAKGGGVRNLYCTREHEFYVIGKGYISASQLRAGDVLFNFTSFDSSLKNDLVMIGAAPLTVKQRSGLDFVKGSKISTRTKESDAITVYDITTETGNFIANGVLSHNCDTPYSSWKPEYTNYSVEELRDAILRAPIPPGRRNKKHIIFTGGEPTLFYDILAEVIKSLPANDYHFSIETAGTIPFRDIGLDLCVVSPKLKNSVPVGTSEEAAHEKLRTNLSALQSYVDSRMSSFKFVVSNKRDLNEVFSIIDTLGISYGDVFLMPEGRTTQEVIEKLPALMEYSKQYGFRVSDRLHVITYGDKRGV